MNTPQERNNVHILATLFLMNKKSDHGNCSICIFIINYIARVHVTIMMKNTVIVKKETNAAVQLSENVCRARVASVSIFQRSLVN